MNVFANFDKKQWNEARSIIVTSVLNTDMASHFSELGKITARLTTNGYYY